MASDPGTVRESFADFNDPASHALDVALTATPHAYRGLMACAFVQVGLERIARVLGTEMAIYVALSYAEWLGDPARSSTGHRA